MIQCLVKPCGGCKFKYKDGRTELVGDKTTQLAISIF